MSLKETLQRLTGRGAAGDKEPSEVVRAVDEGDPTRTVVTDEEPPPIEQ